MRKMKDSGIEWIGDIPKDWDIKKVKFCFYIISGSGFADSLQGQEYGDLPVCKASDISNAGHNLYSAANYLSNEQAVNNGFTIIPKDSILFPKIGEAMKKNRRSIARVPCCLDNNCQAIVPYSNINSDFSYYTMLCVDMLWFDNNGTVPCINNVKFKNSFLPYPPLLEQQKIADYLDHKCAETESIISDIQKQIETLEEYKKSVITEAVTKGRDRNVPMKDSGILGIGKVPAKWGKSRLNYECYIRARLGWRGLKADEYVDEGYAFISAFNIQNGKLVWTPLNYITKERYDESPEIKLNVGDVLLVKDGAGVGKCARVDSLPFGSTAPNSSICVITPNSSLSYKYVCYYIQSHVFSNFVTMLYNGMGVPHLTQEILKSIKILLPSFQEQEMISDFLDKKCLKIDSTISEKKKQIETLEEYKKSLIFEYVTGKREVT